MANRINIVSKINGVGLDQDVRILTNTLKSQGFEVSFSEHKGLKSLWRYIHQSRHFDANIFIERIFPCWMGYARKNFVIPNQERFPKRLLPALKKTDGVLCKTQHALKVFALHNLITEFVGFTSVDHLQTDLKKNYSEFFHLAGKSSLKGTEEIIELWREHPEWPQLTLVQHVSKAPDSVPDNIRLYAEHLSDEKLKALQNSIGIHLCPSRSEGWGHYIVEAMSTSAVVLTTDGEPMNELIDPGRGVLVKTSRTEKRHLGTNFYIDSLSLEFAIGQLIAAEEAEKFKLGRRAREWFVNNHIQFESRLATVLKAMI